MGDYFALAKKLADSEERLFAILDELMEVRRQAKVSGYSNPEHAQRGEKLFDAGVKERNSAQALFDALATKHKTHWQREYERELDAARQALLPLARAWRISHRAFGAIGHFPSWAQGRLQGGLLSEAEAETAGDKHERQLDPPKSFALDRADDELRS